MRSRDVVGEGVPDRKDGKLHLKLLELNMGGQQHTGLSYNPGLHPFALGLVYNCLYHLQQQSAVPYSDVYRVFCGQHRIALQLRGR